MNTQAPVKAFGRVALLATALGVSSAHAWTPIYWKGGSGTEAEPRDVYSKDNWTASSTYSGDSIGQSPTGQHSFNFKADSLTYLTNCSPSAVSGNICDPMMFHTGDYSLCGFFKTKSEVYVGADAGYESIVTVNGGSVTVGGALYVGGTSSAGGTGTLTINGGNVVVAAGKNTLVGVATGATGTINLNGGVLTTMRIAKDKGKGYLNFNGGTLQANADHTDYIKNGVGITVLAGGGTIDCNGKNIAIDAQWSTESTGGMNFMGGNGKTISILNQRYIQYPGITSIAPGTRLAVSNLGASKNLIANGLVVAGVPTVGDTIFTCTRGDGYTLDGVSLDNVKCPIAPGTTFALDDSKTNIVVTSVGALAPAFWTGAAGDDNLSTPGNWSDNTVPTGNATISCASPATLTKGAAFAPTAITFAEGSAAVTIDGGDFTGVVAVTNLSSSSHTINAKVYFAGDIQVKQPAMAETGDLAKPHVTFAGGAYAAEGHALENGSSAAVYSRIAFGEYHLRNTAPWSARYYGSNNRVCVADGATLHIPKADNLTALYIGANAHVFVGELAATFDQRASLQNYGEMVVSNLTTTGSGSGAKNFHVTYNQGKATPAVFKFNAITNSMYAGSGAPFNFADANAAARHVFYIGEGGVFFKDTEASIFVLGKDAEDNKETIRPWYSDFSFGERPGGSAALRIFRSVEFNTDDEGGTGRTITLEGVTQARGTGPAIYVKGSGTLKVNKTAKNDVQPDVYVSDTSTLSLAAGATLGTGSCSVDATATLQLAESGTNAVGNLTLKDGATLKFNFTERKVAPVLDLEGKTVTFGDLTNINVSVNGSVRPSAKSDGKLFLTSGGGFPAPDVTVAKAGDCPDWVKDVGIEDGNLYASVVPTGLMILVK